MFIGRTKELRLIQSFLEQKDPGIVVLYGRRRIGKTALIEESVKDRNAYWFEGVEDSSKQQQIQAFYVQMQMQLPNTNKPSNSWLEALSDLRAEIENVENPVIILDEFQWMANYRKEIVSELKLMWDRYLSKIPGCKLILCGSVASFILHKVVHANALYGRIQHTIQLESLSLSESSLMLPHCGFDEVLLAQMLYGGVPGYLRLASQQPSILSSAETLMFEKHGFLYNDYQKIFVSHFGKTPIHQQIIESLAAHPEGLTRSELVKMNALDHGKNTTSALQDLESAGFIRPWNRPDKPESQRRPLYLISDHYLHFYFSIIQQYQREIDHGKGAKAFDGLRNSGKWYQWLGKAFESVCLNHQDRIAEILGFSGISYQAGPLRHVGKTPGDGFQIDLLFNRADGVFTLCEMKHQIKPVGKSVIQEVEDRADKLGKLNPRRSIHRILITSGEVSQEVERSGYFYRIIRAEDLLQQ